MSVKIGMSFTGSNVSSMIYKKPTVIITTQERLTSQSIVKSGQAVLEYQRSNPKPIAMGATNLGNMFSPRPKRGCGCGH